MGAVQNAMQRDGLDPTIMDLDHNKSVASQRSKEKEDGGPPLDQDPQFQKYFKVRLPPLAGSHSERANLPLSSMINTRC
jgi:hypothetical protein